VSKLSTHQIRAMIAGINATIAKHEARPANNASARTLTESHRKLDNYRAELAEREAAERAQDAEQETSQAAPEESQPSPWSEICKPTGAHSPAAPEEPAPLPTAHQPPKHTPITAAPVRTDPDDELRNLCTSMLKRWTLGTIVDQLWQCEAQLFGKLTQPRQARAKRGAA
jgi:hypothetical protein